MTDLKKSLTGSSLSFKEALLLTWRIFSLQLVNIAALVIVFYLPLRTITYLLTMIFPLSFRQTSGLAFYSLLNFIPFLGLLPVWIGVALATETRALDYELGPTEIIKTTLANGKAGLKTYLTYFFIFLSPAIPFIFRPILFLPGYLVYLLSFGALTCVIVLAFPYCFVVQTTALRNQKGKTAFQYSKSIWQKEWKKILLFLVAFGLVSALGAALLSLPLRFFSQNWFQSIVTASFQTFIMQFFFVALTLVFLNLDYLKNGLTTKRYADFKLKSSAEEKDTKEKSEKTKGSSQKQNFIQKFLNSERVKKITNKLFQEKNEKTLQSLIELERETPQDTRIKMRISEILYHKGEIEEAIEKLQDIATIHEQAQFFLKAIDAYKTILKIKPDFIAINLKLATLYLKLNMINEAANQYRIAVHFYASEGDQKNMLNLAEKLVELDPSDENRAKLAEIYQGSSLADQAVEQYEILAKNYRLKKNYNKLLYFYELILPFKPDNRAILRDVCILHLRQKNPARALHVMEQYNVSDESSFKDLTKKANLMAEALKKQKTRKLG